MSSSSTSAVESLARSGPLWPRLADVLGGAVPPPSEWASHGEAIARTLTGGGASTVDALEPALAARVFHLYLPIYFFARERARAARLEGGGAVAIGLSAPQGCGKTTLVDLLVDRFAADGLTCAALSFDDFYLTGDAQDGRAAASPANPLLQVRGNAGTHDLALGTDTLRALTQRGACESPQAAQAAPARVSVPRYDKSARGGRGDRAPEETWPSVALPVDVVLLEGWMAGFEPLPADAPVLSEHAGLGEVNAALAAYAEWHAMMDAWIVLAVDGVECVYEWRLQAERAMAAAGRPGMSDAQVADFVSRYMPAYTAYLPALYAAADSERGAFGKPTLLVHVDQNRAPVARPGGAAAGGGAPS